ncbi:MAG: VIT1/CCC1 transporter family protein [Segniliparus sp.]|uniref:VIT1/CCC1 transporter family protein n=1 Tax=Segniliparus sp. TaxID=2804064 RepID=UPI003F3EF2C3
MAEDLARALEDPHGIDHQHPDVAGGWLRPAVFGAMDGLVTNTALIAGAGGSGLAPHAVALTGVAGLVAGAFSMALGEYTSVTAQNEQLEAQVRVEEESLARVPDAEQRELAGLLTKYGMSEETAAQASREIHRDNAVALRAHVIQEIGLDPDDQPSPLVAAGLSFLMFALGALVPLLPYIFGFGSLAYGLAFGFVGFAVAGAFSARLTAQSIRLGALRQLGLGMAAVAATYSVGLLVGHSVA